ncbi:MAG: DUF4145 domain-containing protein, partial [Deltaproteobacteria bacterium]|nr:DUF4145 domain-containing protein [Deltaproteobacteria bacterium]
DPEFLKKMGWDDQYLDPEFLKELGGLSDEERDELRRFKQGVTNIASSVVKAKTWPTTDFTADLPAFLDKISRLTGDDPLDSCLTRLALKEIPDAVVRLKKLQSLHVRTMPENRVKNYFQQASSCYICGIYDAVAVLSRSLIQFALEEAFKARNGSVRLDLEDLINFAERTGILESNLAGRAHSVRKIGNDAAHENHTDEPAARKAITDTVQVLTHIYTNIPKSQERDA